MSERRTGRTTMMLERVIESALQGRRHVRVVAHAEWYARDLRLKVAEMLEQLDVDISASLQRKIIDLHNGSAIEFVGSHHVRNHRYQSPRPDREFWDHHALETY